MLGIKRILSILSTLVILASTAWAQESAKQNKKQTVAPSAALPPVVGGGTGGQVTKWLGDGSNTFSLGDSNITEDKTGKVGIGTRTPTAPLTVRGTIETTVGGFKFPDGTMQGTSAAGSLLTVAHDATLQGAGTTASPLSIASPLIVRDLDNPARQPVQKSSFCSAGIGFGCSATIYTVPAGKRLVIEYVSMSANVAPGLVGQLLVQTILDGELVSFGLPLSSPSGIGAAGVRVAQALRLYADPGTNVVVVGSRDGLVSSADFLFALSGYLVDIP